MTSTYECICGKKDQWQLPPYSDVQTSYENHQTLSFIHTDTMGIFVLHKQQNQFQLVVSYIFILLFLLGRAVHAARLLFTSVSSRLAINSPSGSSSCSTSFQTFGRFSSFLPQNLPVDQLRLLDFLTSFPADKSRQNATFSTQALRIFQLSAIRVVRNLSPT